MENEKGLVEEIKDAVETFIPEDTYDDTDEGMSLPMKAGIAAVGALAVYGGVKVVKGITTKAAPVCKKAVGKIPFIGKKIAKSEENTSSDDFRNYHFTWPEKKETKTEEKK